jgi:hypothetical protein
MARSAGLTIWAVMSEDPATWAEVGDYWPRYRTPLVGEFLENLPLRQCELQQSVSAISGQTHWLAFDLVGKRVFSGKETMAVGRDGLLSISSKDHGSQRHLLPIHLPPWWELHESVNPSRLLVPRESPIVIPHTDRHMLFGSPMLEDLAGRMIHVAIDGRLPELPKRTSGGWPFARGRRARRAKKRPDRRKQQAKASRVLHGLTVEIHRQWLMTERQELEGRRPRDLLHGAHQWIDEVIEGQRLRFERGASMIAAPQNVAGYDRAPMGREEMIIYFDLCRELIAAGWGWCRRPVGGDGRPCGLNSPDVLESFLTKARDRWLRQPYEGGSPPQFIIECSRRRVPRAINEPIEGMDQSEIEQHLPDCDCPICEMLQSGLFGVEFSCLDGYHLELDGDFAFSMEESYEDWELSQSCWDEFETSDQAD